MTFQRDSHLVETAKCGLVQTTCLASHPEHVPAKVDGADLRLIAVLLPIRVNNPFNDIGVEERCQGGETLDRYAEPNGHARHCDKFGPSGLDRSRATRLNTLAVKGAVGLI